MGFLESANIFAKIGDILAFAYREITAIFTKKRREKEIEEVHKHTEEVKKKVDDGDIDGLNKEFGWDPKEKK